MSQLIECAPTRKVDVRLPGKGNSNSHGARSVHLIITMIKWIRTSRLSIKNSLSTLVSSQTARSVGERSGSACPQRNLAGGGDPSGKRSQERLTRGTVTSTMRRAAHPSGCARCGAGAGCRQKTTNLSLPWYPRKQEGASERGPGARARTGTSPPGLGCRVEG